MICLFEFSKPRTMPIIFICDFFSHINQSKKTVKHVPYSVPSQMHWNRLLIYRMSFFNGTKGRRARSLILKESVMTKIDTINAFLEGGCECGWMDWSSLYITHPPGARKQLHTFRATHAVKRVGIIYSYIRWIS
jgi:hypothetical protein